MQDFANNCKVVQAIKAQSVSGAVTSASIDCSGYDEAMIILDCGTITATGTLDVKVQESAASGTGQVDITGAVFTQLTPSNDDAVYVGRIRMAAGRMKYINIVATQATAAALASVTVVLGQAKAVRAQTPAFSV